MKHVLYVEDSTTSQLLMRKYVGAMCTLTIMSTPGLAVNALNERPFDLLITDFLFPDGDAMDLIHFVRKTPSLAKMPIVVVSSSMNDALLSKALKAGANDGAAKPLGTTAFRGMIERMLYEPYVRSLDQAIEGVTCIQWTAHGVHYEYCPDLQLLLSAGNREELTTKMLQALQERAKQGAELGFTTHEKIVTRLVQR